MAITPGPEWLSAISATTSADLPAALPLRALLDGSVFYPAARFDGTPVRLLAGRAPSFVYVDYGIDQASLLDKLEAAPFAGYDILGSRAVRREELIPDGWIPRPPRHVRLPPEGFTCASFARWLVLARQPDFAEEHGPSRFSLLYIGGDGVATFQALYHGQSVAPLAICVIQPGHAFGGNWTNFTARDQAFAEVVMDHRPELRPELLAYGGRGDRSDDYRPACWPEFDVEIGAFTQDRHEGETDAERGRVVLYRRSLCA